MTIKTLSFENLPINKPLITDITLDVSLYKMDNIENYRVLFSNICFVDAAYVTIEDSSFITFRNLGILLDKFTYNHLNELNRYNLFISKTNINNKKINTILLNANSKYIFIGGGVPFFFGHFIFEYLPRFEALYNSNYVLEEYKIIVSSDFPQYCINIINLLYSNKFNFIKLDNKIKYNLNQLVLISSPFSRLFGSNCAFLFAEQEFLNIKNRLLRHTKINYKKNDKQYLLILSRSSNKIRICQNIKLLISMILINNLNRNEIIHINNIEDYDISEQINLINNASYIIEEMGSGTPFTGLVKKEATPWIIFGSNQFSAYAVRVLVSLLGNKPIFCTGEIIQSEGFLNSRTHSIEYNYNLDVDKIFQLIQNMLKG